MTLLLQPFVAIRKLTVFPAESISLCLDGLNLLILLREKLSSFAIASTGVASSTELLNGLFELEDVEDKGIGAVEDERKEKSEATKVPAARVSVCGVVRNKRITYMFR